MLFAFIKGLAFLIAAAPIMAVAGTAPAPQDHDLDPGFLQLMGDFGLHAEPAALRTSREARRADYQFADGSRLIVQKSDAAPGKVSVNGLIGSGRLGLPEKLARSAWGMAFLPLGGTSAASYEEIEQWLVESRHGVELNFNPELRGFRFWGTAPSQEIGYQISLLCGIVRHAGMREVVSRKATEFGSTLSLQIEMNPQLVLARAIGRAASGLGNRYDELPLGAEISSDIAGDLQAIADRELGGPMDLAVVGDIDPDTVAAFVGKTCAAGARIAPPRQPLPLMAHFETGAHRWTFVQSTSGGPSPVEALVWSAENYGRGERHRQALGLLADILRVRLSLRLSTPAQRVIPMVAVTTGFMSDRFGFFAVALEHQTSENFTLTELIGPELKALLRDPALDGQIAAVIKTRAVSRSALLASNQQLAAALAESLSRPEAITRFEQTDAGDLTTLVEDVRDAAHWLLNERQQAKITLQPRD